MGIAKVGGDLGRLALRSAGVLKGAIPATSLQHFVMKRSLLKRFRNLKKTLNTSRYLRNAGTLEIYKWGQAYKDPSV